MQSIDVNDDRFNQIIDSATTFHAHAQAHTLIASCFLCTSVHTLCTGDVYLFPLYECCTRKQYIMLHLTDQEEEKEKRALKADTS